MSRPSVRRRALVWATATVIAASAACSTKDDEAATGSAGDAGSGALETGPGVTDDAITLGVLTDQSGPFAGASRGIAQGRQLFWDARNAEGGVCDRTVEFTVTDHGYNAQNATTQYAAMQPEVLAFDARYGLEIDRSLADGDPIEATEFVLRALHTPGHASNHLCYLLNEERTLFTGDHIMQG